MLETQFLLVNAHFTISLFAGLVYFAVAWLYFDAWLGRHNIKESTKSAGFLALSLSFVINATAIEQSVLEAPLFGADTIALLTNSLRVIGYIILIFGQITDPLQPLPEYRRKKAGVIMLLGLPLLDIAPFTLPILAAITGYLYIRRATMGLEFHLRTIGYSFFVLSTVEVISIASQFRGTTNINLANLVAPFGSLWILEHILLIIAVLIIGHWVWGYLIKRLETQLFMIFTTVTLVVFLATAVFFTSVSLANLRQDILASIETNVQVLAFTINSKKSEVLSDAQVIAQNPETISSIIEEDNARLAEISSTTLLAKNQATLIIVSGEGKVLARADDPDKIGGSLSSDPLVKKALNGTETTGIITTEGVQAPSVAVRAASPIKDAEGEIIGAALVGSNIDNAFVDGLKDATSLDASIYGNNIRSATTFIAPDGKSRWIGIKEESEEVKKTVLADGERFVGGVSILNTPFFAAFAPLKDSNDSPVGMLFVGRPQVSTIKAAGALIEQTFLVTVGLLIISTVPSFFISKYIIDQINS